VSGLGQARQKKRKRQKAVQEGAWIAPKNQLLSISPITAAFETHSSAKAAAQA
jgi:hypothetical protein